jgi:2'-hydroxyisoflavone reductase
MDILVLGGTGWLGREVASQALARGHGVTCLARGKAGEVAQGAVHLAVDRSSPDAYDAASDRDWGAVVEVSWQPGFVRGALAALAKRAGHWTYVSSISAYLSLVEPGGTEADELHPPLFGDTAEVATYGQAKAVCEQASRDAVGDRLLVARSGLIGGPGDHSGRSGWWVARAARAPQAPLLVPDSLDTPTQVIDVRDLASWILDSAESGTTGTYDAVGPTVPLGDWIEASRKVGGHTGPVVLADPRWLLAHDVAEWSGPSSLGMWLIDKEAAGMCDRSGQAAREAGLRNRPRRALLEDLLAWERTQGLDRDRPAGLNSLRESKLLAALAAESLR